MSSIKLIQFSYLLAEFKMMTGVEAPELESVLDEKIEELTKKPPEGG